MEKQQWQQNIAAQAEKFKSHIYVYGGVELINLNQAFMEINLNDLYPHGEPPRSQDSRQREASANDIKAMLEEISLVTETPVLLKYPTGSRYDMGIYMADKDGSHYTPELDREKAVAEFSQRHSKPSSGISAPATVPSRGIPDRDTLRKLGEELATRAAAVIQTRHAGTKVDGTRI